MSIGSRRFARLAVSAGLVVASLAPAAAANLLSNPGFEDGVLTPWFQAAPAPSGDPNDWAVTSSDAHSGSFCAIDQDNRSLRQDFAAVPTSDLAEVSFWLKHPDTLGGQTAIDFFYSDNGLNEVIISTTTLDWELHDVTASLLAGKELVGISVYGYNGSAPNHTLIDDVTIALVTTTTTTTTTTTLPPCPMAPAAGCLGTDPGKGALSIKDSADDTHDKLSWKWAGATANADFGDPTATSDYHLCVYQGGTLASGMTAPAGGTCAGKPCWKSGSVGFAYRDKDATPDGLVKLRLKPSGKKAGKIAVSGKGVDLPLAAGPLATPVEVQLSRSDGGPCWTGTFSSPKRNDAGAFKSKSD